MTELADNPDFWQLKKEFLAFAEKRHAEFGYSTDFKGICESLGIKIQFADIPDGRSAYTVVANQPLILLDSAERATRSAFSLAHELCHYFFDDDEYAFKATLADRHRAASQEALRDMEEELCYSGAGVLLFPRSVVKQALDEHGLHPDTVIGLAENSPGSLHAALRRVIDVYMDSELWGFIVNRHNTIEYHHKTKKYQPRKQAQLPPTHPVLAARTLGYMEVRAPAHFKPTWPIHMRAMEHNGRVIVIAGSEPLPPTPNSAQGALFPDHMVQI